MIPAPSVSVVVPVRDAAMFLAEALESVANQTLGSWECIVVDDGSRDATPEIAAEFARHDSRFRLIRQPELGVSTARNRAISEARGRYVQFLDGDDQLLPTKFSEQAAVLDRDEAIDVVLAPVIYFSNGVDVRTDRRLFAGAGADALRTLSRGSPAISAPLVRRSAIDRGLMFPESLAYHEDWFFWIALAASGRRFAYVPGAPVSRVRWHRASVSADRARMQSGLLDLLPLLDDLASSSSGEKADVLRSLCVRLRARLAMNSRAEGGPRGPAVRNLVAGALGGINWRERARDGLMAIAAVVLPAGAFRFLAGRSISRLMFRRMRR